MGWMLTIKFPACLEVRGELYIFEVSPQHLDRHRAVAKNGIVEFAICHPVRVYKLVVHRPELQRSHEISALIRRSHRPIEGTPHLRERVLRLKPDIVDQELNTLLW